jgi:cupin 2 domain-containing protein
MERGNLLSSLGARGGEERFITLARGPGVRVERIVSYGQRSPDGFWYDQAEREFVLLIAGGARLEIEGSDEIALTPGDWVDLPAHCRHRVSWTDPEVATVWLAVFYAEAG